MVARTRSAGEEAKASVPPQGFRIGAHISIAKSLSDALRMAKSIGANTFQFFTRNPRGGAARQIGGAEIEIWDRERSQLDVAPVVGHLPYTVNLGAAPGKLRDFALMVLAEDIVRVGEIGGELVVSHPGRHDGDPEAARERIVSLVREGLNQAKGVWEERPDQQKQLPTFLLEAMAGQGKEIGSLEDLARILDLLDWPPEVGICLDSAHLFAAGWDLRTPDGCGQLVERLEGLFGLDRVKAMHLNDSQAPLASHRDRHACIGQGELGDGGISAIVNHPFLGSLPLLLETTVEKYQDYAVEIQRVLQLRNVKA